MAFQNAIKIIKITENENINICYLFLNIEKLNIFFKHLIFDYQRLIKKCKL